MSRSNESLALKIEQWMRSGNSRENLPKFIFSLFWKYRQFIIFLTGGGVGALTNWVTSFFLTSIEGLHYIVSFALAQIINITVNFLWHTFITFKVKDRSGHRYIRFVLMSVVTASVSIGLVYVSKEYLLDRLYQVVLFGYDLNYLVAIILITFIVALLNFTISKAWVFRQDRD